MLHQVVGGIEGGVALDPPLSIKCVLGGSTHYYTGTDSAHRVDANHYLILNRGHDYTFEKDMTTQVETFCVFFPSTLVPAIAAQSTRSDAQLLEWDSSSNIAFGHFEHCRRHGSRVSRAVLEMRRQLLAGTLDDAQLEELLIRLGHSLVAEHQRIHQRIRELPYTRPQTRRELFRRVHRARDFLHANYAAPITVSDAAQIAAMSPFHFLRTFRQILGETPALYLQRVRIEQATWLLRHTKLPVTEIASQVGYQSLTSFSRVFAQHMHIPPRAYRLTN